MKFFPALLALAEEPIPEDATLCRKITTTGTVGCVGERWRQLREIRHQIAHEYEDAPALKAAVLNRFINDVGTLLAMWMTAEVF